MQNKTANDKGCYKELAICPLALLIFDLGMVERIKKKVERSEEVKLKLESGKSKSYRRKKKG